MPVNPTPDIRAIFRQRTLIDDALNEAARQALIHHKRIGNPIAHWQDGKVVIVQPEDIVVPPPVRPAPDQGAGRTPSGSPDARLL